MLYALLTILLVALDQAVKFLVRAHIPPGGSTPFLPPLLELTYVRNTGAAFSLLEEHTWLLAAASAAVVCGIALALWKKVFRHPLGVTPAVLVLAGGMGNLIDRVAFGFVTDMFRTLFISFPVFNVADICITVGGFWLVLYVIFGYDKLEKRPDKKEAAADDGSPDVPSDRP